MITAKEAREISLSEKWTPLHDEKIEEITRLIKDACDNSERQITYYQTITPLIEAKIKDFGYNIKKNIVGDTLPTANTISW